MPMQRWNEDGPYLEVLLDSQDQHFHITMPNRPAATFALTGPYQWECDDIARRSMPATETNNEGHFTTRIDTYIEKLND